jgi:cell wall-associated NlpC family hydrolase
VKGQHRVNARTREVGRTWCAAVTSRLRLGLVVVSGAALTLTLFSGPQAGPAAADPPLTVADAKAQIEQLEVDAEALDQDYAGVQEQIKLSEAKLKRKKADAKDQGAKVKKMKAQVGQVALAQFQNRSLDTAAQLFLTEDTQGFLDQISTVEKVSENQNTVLQDFQQEQAELADLERSTKSEVAGLEDKEKQLSSLRAASEKKVAEAKAVLTRLSIAQQRAIVDDEQKATAEAQAEAQKADATSTSGGGDKAAAGSSRGAKALAFAKSQIGKPYRFGSSGPNAYDCSGLTGAAWRSVGVSLPRTSQGQYRGGRAISRSELQPGDLVFFYGGISHVGIYAGNGMMVHAPRPGKGVQYIKMKYMPYAGARRPG